MANENKKATELKTTIEIIELDMQELEIRLGHLNGIIERRADSIKKFKKSNTEAGKSAVEKIEYLISNLRHEIEIVNRALDDRNEKIIILNADLKAQA